MVFTIRDDHEEIGDVANEAVCPASQPYAQVITHINEGREFPDFPRRISLVRSNSISPIANNPTLASNVDQPTPTTSASRKIRGLRKQAVEGKAQRNVDDSHDEYQPSQSQRLEQDYNGRSQDGERYAEYADSEEVPGFLLNLRRRADESDECVAE